MFARLKIATINPVTASCEIRMAEMDLDGYCLLNAVDAASAHPETFLIPCPRDRYSVGIGDTVQLEFVYSDGDAGAHSGERMWVEVAGYWELFLLGRLVNQPQLAQEHGASLSLGDQIVFLPGHIISIWDSKQQSDERYLTGKAKSSRGRPRLISAFLSLGS